MLVATLEFVSGGEEQYEIQDGHYWMDGDKIAGFYLYSESDEDHDYYNVYQLRVHQHNHDGWLGDLFRYRGWMNAGSNYGAKQGGIHFGPRGIQPGATGGMVVGASLAYMMPSIKEHALDYLRELRGQSGHSFCYVDCYGNEVFWGPLKL